MPRARDLGIPLRGQPGEWNAITDVPGVEVGYETLISGDGALEVGGGPVRTGVTAVLPLGRAAVGRSCPAGWYSLNGNGEMTGTAWLDETGALSLPVGITNTHAVGPVHRGIIDWSIRASPSLAARWHLPVVAETWDGYLNDINGAHVTPQTAMLALDSARGGPIAEGSVGGGTGMNCYGFKGGTGTASRRVRVGSRGYTVGTLMQANFGSRAELVVAGRYLGAVLSDDNPMRGDRLARPARRRVVHHDRGHRRPAAARPVQGAGAPGAARPGPDGHDGQPLLGRPVPGVLRDQRGNARQLARFSCRQPAPAQHRVRAVGAA